MTSKQKGPREFGSSCTAHHLNRFGPQWSDPHDNDNPAGTQSQGYPDIAHQSDVVRHDSVESLPATPVYDPGWSTRCGSNVRVRWYRLPDGGSKRRWVSHVLSRYT